MGEKLKSFFNDAKEIAGVTGQMKMAMITKMSAKKALEADDSAENISIFTAALEQIEKG